MTDGKSAGQNTAGTKAREAKETDDIILEYIMRQPEAIRPLLAKVRRIIRTALPDAIEKISWGMPTYRKEGNLIHFAAQKNHLGVYPGAAAMEHFRPLLAIYKTSKGAVQFPYKTFSDEQLKLIGEIAFWCGKK